MTQLPIAVHIGSEAPEQWEELEERQRRNNGDLGRHLSEKRRPSVASPDLDWPAMGFEPRWVGLDTADCSAALQPSIFSGQGADEFNRFRQGAEGRGEVALVISPIGEPQDGSRNTDNIFGPPVDSVLIGRTQTSVAGQRIGQGARIRVVDKVGDADRELALRVLNWNPTPTWRSLSLIGTTLESVHGQEQHAPEGTLLPILETELGEPVVAVWLSRDGVERRYIVPVEVPWKLLLSWLLEKAMPEFVPDTLRRARRVMAFDEYLMTRSERDARSALTALDADYAARRRQLETQLKVAESAAAATREGLLYGTGQQLVAAVTSVFEYAGVDVINLDEELGGTKNADLLCAHGGTSLLVEVKAATGSAPERAYQDLVRHMREWTTLPGATPIRGGVLVISHDLRAIPHERNASPYTRPEFLNNIFGNELEMSNGCPLSSQEWNSGDSRAPRIPVGRVA
nr:hypothetical protein [Rhodococcus sp. (in: high G+C Gram-positive bacteria)]